VLLDFGRLSLQGIKENRYLYTDAETKSSCQTFDHKVRFFFLSYGPTLLVILFYFICFIFLDVDSYKKFSISTSGVNKPAAGRP